MIEAAHDAGLTVIPWTVDDRTTMEHLIELGVDGLITNYPNRLREVLQSLGRSLPKSYSVPATAVKL
jgi:glycerophosphoryl diester phosphodiesterase